LCRLDPVTGQFEYEAERLARMLHNVVRVDLSPGAWNLRLTALEHAKAHSLIRGSGASRTFIAAAPGAKLADKDWGAGNWAALLASLAEDYRDAVLVLVGAPDERAVCEGLAGRWTGAVLNLCGTLTPRETAAVLAHCRLLVCHDSGPMHMETAIASFMSRAAYGKST
jgi:ADP-heptose:LPS heptosyltransferase